RASRALPGSTRDCRSCLAADGHSAGRGAANAALAVSESDSTPTNRDSLRMSFASFSKKTVKDRRPVLIQVPGGGESAPQKEAPLSAERGAGTALTAVFWLVDVQREVVDHEGGLQRAVLHADEEDLDGLTREREQVVALLREARGLVQVGEGLEGREHRARGVADLHLQGIERGDGGRLGRVDVEPEGEGRAGGGRRDRHRLE